MKKHPSAMRILLSAVAAFALLAGSAAVAEPVVEKLHFLIPGGAGGGWDGTARGTGEALTKAGLVGSASYENIRAAAAARRSVF